jgi:hypothetical protein
MPIPVLLLDIFSLTALGFDYLMAFRHARILYKFILHRKYKICEKKNPALGPSVSTYCYLKSRGNDKQEASCCPEWGYPSQAAIVSIENFKFVLGISKSIFAWFPRKPCPFLRACPAQRLSEFFLFISRHLKRWFVHVPLKLIPRLACMRALV